MRRREFMALAGAGMALVHAAPAQQKAMPKTARLGWLAHGDTMPRHFFEQAMAGLGWVEGQNLTVERRFTGSAGENLAAEASALVGFKPDVIVAMGAVDAIPILAITRSIPIVVVTANDPVGQGLAVSISRPGGNVTGTASITRELLPKLIELVHELLPEAQRISVLGDPTNPGNIEPSDALGKSLGLTIRRRHATRPTELEFAFASAVAASDQAMVVQFSALTFEERLLVTALAGRFRLPCVFGSREYVEAGGLISYGPVFRENFERAAALVDKILHGARPADLPIEQPTKFELVINLKTAKALGLTVPQALLARADEVIE